jgi:hypothetical protein
MKQHVSASILLLLLLTGHAHDCKAEFGWENIEIHGFLSQGFMQSHQNNVFADTLDGTFQFNEFGLNFSTNLSNRLRTGLQFFSRDLGDFDNNTIKLDWAYADFRWKDWLGFRAGRIKSPCGLHMETADLDMLRTSIFLPQSLYNDSMRDINIAVNGIGLYGYFSLGGVGDVTYQLQYGETSIETDGTMVLYMESEADARLIHVESHPVFGAHIEWMPPVEGIRLTGSFTSMDLALRYTITEQTDWAQGNEIPVGWEFPHIMDNMVTLIAGIEVTRTRTTFMAEYEYKEAEVTQSAGYVGLHRSAGYYASLAYRFTDWFELATYYSVYDDDLDDRDGSELESMGMPKHLAWQKDWTVTTRFDISEYWLIKVEFHFIDGTALLLNQHNPEGVERNSVLFAVKATYSF